jgi:uncharacterized membrane protein YvlD (DUF360 family)
MHLLLKWLVVASVIALAPQVTTSIRVDGLGSALWAALVYGVLFVWIGWFIKLIVAMLSLVPGILTLGLFFLLVPVITNAVLLKLTAGMLGSFDVRSWSAAFALSLVLTLIGLMFDRPRNDTEQHT